MIWAVIRLDDAVEDRAAPYRPLQVDTEMVNEPIRHRRQLDVEPRRLQSDETGSVNRDTATTTDRLLRPNRRLRLCLYRPNRRHRNA